MTPQNIDNTVHDEANQVTYVVRSRRNLTDGEIFKAIRIAIQGGGGKRPARGETMVIEHKAPELK